MQSDIQSLFFSMQKELTQLVSVDIPVVHYEKALSIITGYLQQLRPIVHGVNDEDTESVIALHKFGIPNIYSEFIYYATLYNLESAKPFGNNLTDYYRKESERIEAWFVTHDEFLRYYRSNKTHLDESYFVPSSVNSGNYIDLYFPLIENPVCSPYSILAAMGMAYQRVQTDLNRFIVETTPNIPPVFSLQWTHSKTDLTELIYALYASGSFNKGKATIKEITVFFEEVLQIGLGNTSVTFQEILRRKDSTVFLSRLHDCFDRYINQVEQKNIR